MNTKRITVTVNKERVEAVVPVNRLLSDFLRDDLVLTGTKRGCETGICGACSILVDGDVVKSCLSLAVQMDGRSLTTVEGLADDGSLSALQDAFMTKGGLQCGFCTPGFLMAATDFLDRESAPTETSVRQALSGNICRCTGYQGIVDAVLAVAETRNGN